MIPCNRIHSNRYLLYHKKNFFWSSDSTNEWCAYPSRENMAFTRFPFLKVCCCCCCCCCLIPPGWPLRAPRKVGNAFSRCFLRVRIFFSKIFSFSLPENRQLRPNFLTKISSNFWFISSPGPRFGCILRHLEETIQKLVDMASFGPPQSRKIRKNHDFCNFHSNFSLFFFRILAFFFKKLRIKSTLSTNSKKKFKNSLIQPRTSRSNFGTNAMKFNEIQWNSMNFNEIQWNLHAWPTPSWEGGIPGNCLELVPRKNVTTNPPHNGGSATTWN